MKTVLLQDKSLSNDGLRPMKNILESTFSDLELEIETTDCLTNTAQSILEYDLIFAHPHVADKLSVCCLSPLEAAAKKGIPVIVTYAQYSADIEILHALSVNLDLREEKPYDSAGPAWKVYANAIKKYLCNNDEHIKI